MDLLDSLCVDLDNHKKAHRVHSWYLYEQYKSLEKNRLEAAEELNDRAAYQYRILHDELSERRARRKLYDKFGACRSDCPIFVSNINEDDKIYSLPNEDHGDSASGIHDDHLLQLGKHKSDTDLHYDNDNDSVISKNYSTAESETQNGNLNYSTESIESIVEKKDMKFHEINDTTPNFASSIKSQMKIVKDELRSLENYAQSYRNPENHNEISIDDKIKETKDRKTDALEVNSNLFIIWAKIVSFSYHIIEMSHGNNFSDCSYQILTAVIACDILGKCIGRMCDILQPYVCPVKFATEVNVASIENRPTKNSKDLKFLELTKFSPCYNGEEQKFYEKFYQNSPLFARRQKNERVHCSKDLWHSCAKFSQEDQDTGNYRLCEPGCSAVIFSHETDKKSRKHTGHQINDKRGAIGTSSCNSKSWIDEDEKEFTCCKCPCHIKVENPMSNLVKYIDTMFDESKHM